MARTKKDDETPLYGEEGGFLPDRTPVAEWPTYRKRVLTSAIRVEGPFRVKTSEGELSCEDGYLAIDSRGYLYPIAAEEFEAIYEPAAYEASPVPEGAIEELMAEHDMDESQAAARLGV